MDYYEPESVAEATELLADLGDEASVLAGGVSFTLLWRLGLARPPHVVGLRRIDALRELRSDDDGLWLGALTTHRAMERSTIVRQSHPMLADAFGRIATPRIRNQATVGGNLVHADPAQDPPPALIVSDAVAVLCGAGCSRREVPLDQFFVGYLETVTRPDEILLGIRVPPRAPGTRAVYTKFLPRTADDYCTVSVAAAALVSDGIVRTVRVALAGVGPTPVRAREVESALVGRNADDHSLNDAAALIDGEIDPFEDHRGSVRYKRRMAAILVRRALSTVIQT